MTRTVFIRAGHKSVRQHFSPPLGIMSLASYLRENLPDTDVKLIDMAPERLSAEEAADKALSFSPDVAGISAMSYESADMARLSGLLKSRAPDLPVIAGGPHVTTVKERAFDDPNLDYIVTGEGELSLSELLPRVLSGEDISEVAGIGYRENGAGRLTAPREEIVDLDSLPLPAYDLIDIRRYWDLPRFGTTFVNKEYATLSTSRACPYQCTYCHRIFGRRYRSQSPETVLRDLETLAREHSVREIQFVDDCFNLEKKRLAAICDGIVERGLEFSISFPNGIRGDIMDRETLKKLKKAGTYRITYAIETASPRMQKFIKKNVKLDKLKDVIEETDKQDIMVDGFFMVGFPGETREEINMTLDYALSSKLHSANFWFVTPFKGTELYDQAVEMGYQVPDESESLHYFDPQTDLSEVPGPELKKMVQRTFLKFYLHPLRLWRIFKLFPNKKQLPALLARFIKISATWNYE
ncbi:MAG: radical SAM protein [bacterium]